MPSRQKQGKAIKASVPIRTFSHHYRQKFGCKVGKIPLDAGVLCPNRSKGGCIYCQPESFTSQSLNNPGDIRAQLAKGKHLHLAGRFTKYFAYLQQETCTVLSPDQFLKLIEIPLEDESCIGVIISTRPDCISDTLLEALAELISHYKKDCLFELGLQTVHEKSLELLNRNHTFYDFTETGDRIKSFSCFELSAHLLFGIPGESNEEMLKSVTKVCEFGVDALKLHHLQVIKGTVLEKMYQRNEVPLFSCNGYLDFLIEVLKIIPPEVTIHRFWTTSPPDLLVAPKWNILASDLSRTLLEKMNQKGVRQGISC